MCVQMLSGHPFHCDWSILSITQQIFRCTLGTKQKRRVCLQKRMRKAHKLLHQSIHCRSWCTSKGWRTVRINIDQFQTAPRLGKESRDLASWKGEMIWANICSFYPNVKSMPTHWLYWFPSNASSRKRSKARESSDWIELKYLQTLAERPWHLRVSSLFVQYWSKDPCWGWNRRKEFLGVTTSYSKSSNK